MKISTNYYAQTNYNVNTKQQNYTQPQFRAKVNPRPFVEGSVVSKGIIATAAGWLFAKFLGKTTDVTNADEHSFQERRNKLKRELRLIFPRDEVKNEILLNLNKGNIKMAEVLNSDIKSSQLSAYAIGGILKSTTEKNVDAKIKAYKLLKDIPFEYKDIFRYTLCCATEENISLLEKLCDDENFPKDELGRYIGWTTKINLPLAEKLAYDSEIPSHAANSILKSTYKDEKIYSLAEKLYADENFPKEMLSDNLEHINEENFDIAEKLTTDKDYPKKYVGKILYYTNKLTAPLTEKLYEDKSFTGEQTYYIVANTNEENIDFTTKLCSDSEFQRNMISHIIRSVNKDNLPLAEKFYQDAEMPRTMSYVLQYANKKNMPLAERIYEDKDSDKDNLGHILQYAQDDELIELADELYFNTDIQKEKIPQLLFIAERNRKTPAEILANINRYKEMSSMAILVE